MPERDIAEWDREIEAEFQRAVASTRAAGKRKRKKANSFAIVPLDWAARAARATGAPAIVVCVQLLHLAWKAKGKPFLLPNGELKKVGVSRQVKDYVLRKLELAGMIAVERSRGRSPRVTLLKSPTVNHVCR